MCEGALEHEDPGEQTVQIDGEEFLGDELRAFALEVRGFEKPLDELEKLLLFPSERIEISQVSGAVACGIKERCGKEGIRSIGQPDLENTHGYGLRGGQAFPPVFPDHGHGGWDLHDAVLSACVEKGVHAAEETIVRQTDQEVDPQPDEIVEEAKTWIAAVHEEKIPWLELMEKGYRQGPLAGGKRCGHPVDGKLGQDIMERAVEHLWLRSPLGDAKEFLQLR